MGYSRQSRRVLFIGTVPQRHDEGSALAAGRRLGFLLTVPRISFGNRANTTLMVVPTRAPRRNSYTSRALLRGILRTSGDAHHPLRMAKGVRCACQQ